MKKNYTKGVVVALAGVLGLACSKQSEIRYVTKIDNVNYPEVAVWFAQSNLPQTWQGQLDTMLGQIDLDLYVLSPRGTDLLDTAMFPAFRSMVEQSNKKGVTIGMQMPAGASKGVREKGIQTQQVIFDGLGKLDADGKGKVTVDAWGVRSQSPDGVKVYKAFSYLSRGEGLYEAGSLRDITKWATVTVPDKNKPEQAVVTIEGNHYIANRPVIVMVAFDYNFPDMFGGMADFFKSNFDAYGDIPFKAAALDEFSYLRLVPPWQIGDRQYRGRYYSPAMDSAFKEKYRTDLAETMLAMRMVPERQETKRMQAINRYMGLVREGADRAQANFYDLAKERWGADTWIGWHPTYHNQLGGDELWTTGAGWWTTKRDYPDTDEWTPTPTQLGILYSSPSRILYNMFYDPNDEILYEKVLTDLRYGIRTNYHAIDDSPNHYGVDFKAPEEIPQVNRMVEAARLLNRFNPDRPDADVLVVFGNEALFNWFPDTAQRSQYDMRKLEIEEKVVELQQAGYLTALVPTEVIRDGRLTLSRNNRPVLGGHEFDAIVLLYPQYSRPETMAFFDRYLAGGGKLMIEGGMTNDFDGNPVTDRFAEWQKKAVATQFDVADMPKLGVRKNVLEGATRNSDGSVVLTDYLSIKNGVPATFSVEVGRDVFSGEYIGMLAFQPERGEVVKITSNGLKSLRKNGKELLSFDKATGLYAERKEGKFEMTVIDPSGAKPVPTVNRF